MADVDTTEREKDAVDATGFDAPGVETVGVDTARVDDAEFVEAARRCDVDERDSADREFGCRDTDRREDDAVDSDVRVPDAGDGARRAVAERRTECEARSAPVATERCADASAAAADKRPPLTGDRRTRSPGRFGCEVESARRATRSASVETLTESLSPKSDSPARDPSTSVDRDWPSPSERPTVRRQPAEFHASDPSRGVDASAGVVVAGTGVEDCEESWRRTMGSEAVGASTSMVRSGDGDDGPASSVGVRRIESTSVMLGDDAPTESARASVAEGNVVQAGRRSPVAGEFGADVSVVAVVGFAASRLVDMRGSRSGDELDEEREDARSR